MRLSSLLCLGSIAIATVFAAPSANALTLVEVYDEVSGMSCSGSVCSSETPASIRVQNPDIVVDEGATQPGPGSQQCFTETVFGEDISDNPMCFTTGTIAPTGGSSSYHGGFSNKAACTTTTKSIGYDPAGGFFNGWSVDTDVSTSAGAC